MNGQGLRGLRPFRAPLSGFGQVVSSRGTVSSMDAGRSFSATRGVLVN